MVYKCFFCEAALKVPTEVSLEGRATPVSLQCPHCKNITTLELTHLGHEQQDMPLGERAVQFVYRAVKGSFIKNKISPDDRPKVLFALADKLTAFLRFRAWTTFTFLTVVGQALLFWGLFELSGSYKSGSLIHLIPWSAGIVLTMFFVTVYKYLTGDYLNELLGAAERRLFESILHLSLVIFFFPLIQTIFRYLSEFDAFRIQNPEIHRELYGWIGALSWLVVLYFLFYVFRNRVYMYAVLGSILGFSILELAWLFDDWFLGYNILPTPFLQLIMDGYYYSVTPAVYYLIIGPWLGFTLLKAIQFFLPNIYKRELGRGPRRIIYAHYIVIPWYFYFLGGFWEFVAWSSMFLILYIFLLSQSAGRHRRGIFRYGVYLGFLTAVLLYRYSGRLPESNQLWILLGLIVVLFIPNYIFRFRASDEHSAPENEVHTDLGYLSQVDYTLQSLVALVYFVVGQSLFYLTPVYILAFNAFCFFFGMSLLFFNYFRLSHLAKFLPWFYLYGSVIIIIYGIGLEAYGVMWVLLSAATVLISFLWKIYATAGYNRRLFTYVDEVRHKRYAKAEPSASDANRVGSGWEYTDIGRPGQPGSTAHIKHSDYADLI